MKKITLVVFTILAFSLSAVAQYSFPAVTGPTNVAEGSPVTLNINDSGNSAAAPASSSGTYLSFSVSVDWFAGGGGPWSSEADLTAVTSGGSILVDPPTLGGGFGDPTTLTFEGDFATPYDPTIDGTLDIILNQSYGGSDADWSNIVVTIFESPLCFEPTNIVVTVDGTSVDFTWDPGDSEAAWEVVNQLDGTGVPTGNGDPLTNNSYGETGLIEGTDYEFYVRANCVDDGYSEWVGPITYSIAGPGETCENPIIVDLPLPYTTSDNTSNYGDNYTGSPGTDCGSTFGYLSGDDVVYAYTPAADTSVDIVLSNIGTYTGMFVYTDCADIGTQCFNGGVNGFAGGDISLQEVGVVAGTTYYIVISTWPSPQSTDYTLTITENTCVSQTVDFTLVDNCDVGEEFFVEVNISDMGSASALSLTDSLNQETETANSAGIISMGPYSNGTDVVITVTSLDDVNCQVVSETFNLMACPPNNDLCIDAETISCGDSVSGATTDATENDEPADFCGTGEGAPGVWYEFTGTGDIVTMSLCNSTFDTKIQVWEGSCDALNCITGIDDACGLQSEVSFISSTGASYFVYVFGYGTSTGDYTLDVTCVEPPPPPANDDCDTPTTITANADDTCTEFASGTVFGATASGQANGCAGSADDDVWFEFEAIATDHAVTLNNATGGLSLGVYEGDDCNNLTELYCSPAFGDPTIVANGLTVGNTYLVRVYSTTADPLQDITFDICVFTIPPPIYTSETDYTVEEIIKDVLANENPDCPQIYNITYSTGTDFGDSNGIGYFEANGSDWPFGAGLIMTSGDINNAPGPEDEILSDGGFVWPGDADLESQIPNMDAGDSNNASIIEFDFVPIIEHMSFDFIFASEEYGTYQCPGFGSFADGFAFLLTDSNGITTNLAFVPGTVDPISIFTVRDEAYNGDCASVNAEYFDSFYGGGGENPLTSPIDFLGHTVIMTAEADVIPGEEYHIKLVVADDADTLFDSAVFIGAGTFDIGYPDLGEDILLGSGQETCEGNPLTLDSGEIPLNADVAWYMDGDLIEGANTQTIQVTETAFYGAEFSYPNGDCALYDEVLIEFYENPEPIPVQETIIRCVGLEVILEVNVNNSDVPDTLEYYWTYDGVDIQQGEDNTYTIAAESDELGEYIVTVIDGRGCYGDTIITVVEGVYPIIEAVETVVDKCINEDATLEAAVTNASELSDMLTYIWSIDGIEMQSSPDNTYVHASGESEAIVTVMVRDEVSQCTDETDISVVYYENANCVDLPQGLSPNGDGFNDCLILDHLEDKEDITQIDIFNRHGIKIYELNDYVDQWCGTDQDGKKIPVGTYFYVIHTKAKEPRTSWIYLNY